MMRKAVYQVDTYENGNLVVSHLFYGKDFEQAEKISRAHEGTDKFYKASVQDGQFGNMVLSNTVNKYWIPS